MRELQISCSITKHQQATPILLVLYEYKKEDPVDELNRVTLCYIVTTFTQNMTKVRASGLSHLLCLNDSHICSFAFPFHEV